MLPLESQPTPGKMVHITPLFKSLLWLHVCLKILKMSTGLWRTKWLVRLLTVSPDQNLSSSVIEQTYWKSGSFKSGPKLLKFYWWSVWHITDEWLKSGIEDTQQLQRMIRSGQWVSVFVNYKSLLTFHFAITFITQCFDVFKAYSTLKKS